MPAFERAAHSCDLVADNVEPVTGVHAVLSNIFHVHEA